MNCADAKMTPMKNNEMHFGYIVVIQAEHPEIITGHNKNVYILFMYCSVSLPGGISISFLFNALPY